MTLDIEEIARQVDCLQVNLAGDRAKAIERLTAFAVEVVKRSTQGGAEPIGYIDPNQIKFLRNGHLRFVTMLRVPSLNQIAPLYAAPPAPASATVNGIDEVQWLNTGLRNHQEKLRAVWAEFDAYRAAHPAAPISAAPMKEPKPPKWYQRQEIVDILTMMNYSDQIAQELADWMVLHLQFAFNKGFQVRGWDEYQSAKTLQVWYGRMPESNGKSNFTAILHKGDITGGFTIARSEYPERVRYDADCVRYLIGELAKEPFILDYDGDKHSGYVAPPSTNAKDAERYRWLRNESWAGYHVSKSKPQVFETVTMVLDGARNFKTILAEDALDAAIDAAIASKEASR